MIKHFLDDRERGGQPETATTLSTETEMRVSILNFRQLSEVNGH